jgi:hypothetical protein
VLAEGGNVISANDYLQMARECMALSVETGTEERRKALISMAKLYTQTALRMQASAPPASDVAAKRDPV